MTGPRLVPNGPGYSRAHPSRLDGEPMTRQLALSVLIAHARKTGNSAQRQAARVVEALERNSGGI